MSKKKEFLWGAIVNMGGGILMDKPKKFYYNDELESWYAINGNDLIDKEGLCVNDGWITFGSKNENEVAAFIMGAKALRDILLNNTLYKKRK